MGTGYTYELEKMKYDVSRWLTESLARGFGVCIMLRDTTTRMKQEDIIKKMAKLCEPNPYNVKSLKKAEKDLKKYKNMTDAEWTTLLREERREAMRQNRIRIQCAKAKKKKNDEVRDKLEGILSNPSMHEITKKIAHFGLEQLSLCDSDEKPYIEEWKYTYAEDFRKDKINEAIRQIEYHKGEIERDIELQKDRLQSYIEIVEDLEKIK